MKRLHILFLLFLLICISACRKNYYIENDLHGMWQVTSIEKLDAGQVAELYAGQLYYLFQRSMVVLCQKGTNENQITDFYTAHFDIIESDSIGVGDFRYMYTSVSSEEKVPLKVLRKYGIYQSYTLFGKQQSKQELILTSDSVRIVLRKY